MTEKVIERNKEGQEKTVSLVDRGVFQLDIKNDEMLYACYMPFVKGCGIFYPKATHFQLADEVFLLLRLPDEEERLGRAAKVVWVNPKQKLGRRLPGAGLQLLGRDIDVIREKIEKRLGKRLKSPISTATM